ncbi:inosine/guanosine kinase [Marinomonas fungiae]|uniref:Sugar or nucleoside kinase, ribokinase family n=1 Tax=Marinomonas fungiae TaxID=1137284 RepID=A0A0K6IMQ6_9GAMM|nr:inosine/guanosine kinase [Marinomonas fungiae]CUB04381.1 Sugar or nucleoside kinase, ribokinase family [Marinomonas fungiae]
MKFPGRRKIKHYFPATQGKHRLPKSEVHPTQDTYIVGLDETIVDVIATVDDIFLAQHGIRKGLSNLVTPEQASAIYQELIAENRISDHFAGGTIGNTLHNYSVLADDKSVLLGVMSNQITLNSPEYYYLCDTSSNVDMHHLQGVAGDIGRGITLITEDGERTFAIAPNTMDDIEPSSVNEELIANAAAFVTCAYPLRHADKPIKATLMKCLELTKQYNVPVIITLGTQHLVEEFRDEIQLIIEKYASVVAMNEQEAEALTGEPKALLAAEKTLEWCDMVLLTAGAEGLYLCGYCDDQYKRATTHSIKSQDITNFNQWEFSRPQHKQDCEAPIKVYSHIDPYLGGPERICNTNGAGDGALSALLHDIAANYYHLQQLPHSSKHTAKHLSYSSFAQICKYANRVSYEVLSQHSPRLSKGLPEQEDSLEQAYWAR